MENIFEKPLCTFYKSVVYYKDEKKIYLSTPGKNVKILDVLTNERYTNQNLLNELRNSGYKSKFYETNKRRLSAVCFSSVQNDLTISRSDENHLWHTEFITFDIDAKDNPELMNGVAEMKDFLISNVPYIAYIGTSVSNIGLWGLFKVAYPDEHYAHYAAMKQYFKQLNITIDNTSDISRLRFLSYDPDAHFELSPKIFEETLFEEKETTTGEEYEAAYQGEEIYFSACKWVEIKYNLKFKPGMIHNYLLRLYSTLRGCNIPRHKILNWIYNNLIEESLITTNCLDEPKWKK